MSSFGEELDDAASEKLQGSMIKCEECGIACAGKSHYNMHIRTHTGERPYICKICRFGFTQKVNQSLKTHVLKMTIRAIYVVTWKSTLTRSHLNVQSARTNAGGAMHWMGTWEFIQVSSIEFHWNSKATTITPTSPERQRFNYPG